MNRSLLRNLLYFVLYFSFFGAQIQAQAPQLRSYDCNRMNTQLYSDLYANMNGGSQYKFKVTNVELGATDSIVNPYKSFKLNQMPSIARYNSSYEVSVCIDNGSGFGPYGTICTPSSIPIYSRLRQPDCGRELTLINSTVYASVINADYWDFQVRVPNSIVVETIPNLPSRAFNLSMASPFYQKHGQEYEIRIRTMQGGVLQPWGAWCSVFTPPKLATLRTPDCGRQMPSIFYNVYASVLVADSWDFQVRNGGDTNFVEDVFNRPNRTFNLNMTSNNLFKLFNQEYQVRVRTTIDGAVQPWGGWCSIYTPMPLKPPNLPDVSSVSSVGGLMKNMFAVPRLLIAYNVGEVMTETVYGNPLTIEDSTMMLYQGFEQPIKWYISVISPSNPTDMPVKPDTTMKSLLDFDISLYPNPYSNVLQVTKSVNLDELFLTVFDALGSIVTKKIITNTTEVLELEFLSPGSFFFEFRDAENQLIDTKKVIKSY